MDVKHDLAVLFSKLESPKEEFVSNEHFKRLEKESEIIQHIEPFGLPEVTKLICCSNAFETQEWAADYADARKLYSIDGELDVLGLMFQYKDEKELEKRILKRVERSILQRIDSFFKGLEEERNHLKKEKKNLKTKITKAKNKSQADNGNKPDSNTINKLDAPALDSSDTVEKKVKSVEEMRLEELEKEINERESFLKGFSKHAARTKFYLNRALDEVEMNEKRQRAYKVIDDIRPSQEEEFLLHFIEVGTINVEEEILLKNYGFLTRFMELFEKVNYRNMAFPVLARLYSENAIDLESDLIAKFVDSHGILLSEYLVEQYNNTSDFLSDPEGQVLIEYSIKNTINGSDEYVEWWNAITTPHAWKTILDFAKGITDVPLLDVSLRIMHFASGSSIDAFIELIESDESTDINFTPAEFIIEFIGQESPNQKVLIRNYVRKMEQSVRKSQRKLASKEREINRYAQELFSATYLSIEQMEELAFNLRMSDGDIKCSLVAAHLITALAGLREGLAAMGVEPAEEVEIWQNQSEIDYNPQKHKITSFVGDPSVKVKLQTLGYAYVDDEGAQKVRAAEVYVPVTDSEVSTNKSASTPRKRRNKLSSNTHSAKKKSKAKRSTSHNSKKPIKKGKN